MKNKNLFILLFLMLFSLVIIFTSFKYNYVFVSDNEINHKYSFKNSHSPCKAPELVQDLSKRLNNAQKEIGELSFNLSMRDSFCKINKIDEKVAVALSELLNGKNIASFGYRSGEYKKKIISLNQVKSYDAYDASPYIEETTDNEVKHLDLSVPIYHLPLYDWVLSLELGDNISKQHEQIFIDNLTRHAKDGIILSWSRVGHSNFKNQDLSFVEEQFLIRNFKTSSQITKKIKKAASFERLKKNLVAFLRIT